MSDADLLYERDFFLWTVEQARLLRDVAKIRTNLPLDWMHLAEEIESLGVSDRRELRSRIAIIIEHLLKLEFSPAVDPRRGWEDTIGREQLNIALLLEDSPSLKAVTESMVARECPRVGRFVATNLVASGEIDASVAKTMRNRTFDQHQVLGERSKT